MRLILLFICAVSTVCAGEIPISSWRTVEFPLTALAFGDSSQRTADLIEQVKWDWNSLDLWDSGRPVGNSLLNFKLVGAQGIALCATYLTADRYGKAKVEVTGSRPLKLFAGGKKLLRPPKSTARATRRRQS